MVQARAGSKLGVLQGGAASSILEVAPPCTPGLEKKMIMRMGRLSINLL